MQTADSSWSSRAPLAPELTRYLAGQRELLHRLPDLSGEEGPTLQLIRAALGELGIVAEEIRDGHGLFACVRGRSRARRLIFRSPVDALPLEEHTGLPFSSQHPGRMHACGHDATAAILLGVAKCLTQLRSPLEGDVGLLFQPGEETLTGARAVLDSGLVEFREGDHLACFHLTPRLPVGRVGYAESGPLFCGSGTIALRSGSRGGHVSDAGQRRSPLQLLAELVAPLEALAAAQARPGEPLSLSFCQMHAGRADNVLPQSAELRGSVRFRNREHAERLIREISEQSLAAARAGGLELDVTWEISAPPLELRAADTRFLIESLAPVFQADLVACSTSLAAEDAALLLERVPGSYWLIGCTDPERGLLPLHTDRFDFPAATLGVGLRACLAVAARFFGQPIEA